MLHNPRDEEHLSRLIKLLSSSSAELLTTLDTSVSHLIETIHRFKSLENTFASVMKYDEKAVEELIVKSKAQLDKLKQAYKNYRDVKRLEVIKPFAQLFDPYGTLRADEEEDAMATPSHRGLFWSMSYQNSLLGWSEALIELFETIHQVENKRRRPRSVFPSPPVPSKYSADMSSSRLWFPDLRKAYFAHTGAENDYGDEVRSSFLDPPLSLPCPFSSLLSPPSPPSTLGWMTDQSSSLGPRRSPRPQHASLFGPSKPRLQTSVIAPPGHRYQGRESGGCGDEAGRPLWDEGGIDRRCVFFPSFSSHRRNVDPTASAALCSLPAYFPSTSYFFYRERGVWVSSAPSCSLFLCCRRFKRIPRVHSGF